MIDRGGNLVWTVSVFAFFLLDWAAVFFNWHRIRSLTKISAMGSAIAWTFIMAEYPIGSLVIILIAAQFFGLLGDFFLLLQNKWFLWGLGGFLAGHLLYLSLFMNQLFFNFRRVDSPIESILWAIVVICGWLLFIACFYRLFRSLSQRKHIWVPIQVYAWVLSGMTAAALMLLVILSDYKSEILLLPLGAILFTVSDLFLAYSRFIKPIQNGKLLVRITYHFAQFSLAWGFISLLE